MFNALRAEFRKLYTVRSTYILLLLTTLLSVGLVCFWIYGYKDVGHATQNVTALRETLLTAIAFSSLFMGLIAILLVGHEYRYNTILYSLTSANHRSKVFFAKWLALIVWAVVISAVMIGLGVAAFYIGHAVHGVDVLKQTIPNSEVIWRIVATTIGFVSFGFIITMLVRSLVAAIAIYLVMPTTIETLLALLLKDNQKYLPFSALSNLTNTAPANLSYAYSLVVVVGYIVGFGLLAYILFTRRDAN